MSKIFSLDSSVIAYEKTDTYAHGHCMFHGML